MNKIFVLALLIFLQAGTAFASVGTNTENGVNYKMSYPIVYTNDKAVQDKINQDIYHYIAAFKNDYNAGKFYQGRFLYDLKFENDDYISLTITDSRYNMGAAHPHAFVRGVVYDKHTGRKLPLSHFLKITVADLKWFYHGHLYSSSGNKINGWAEGFGSNGVSDDYYLLGNGGIALIYQTYALDAYAYGATTIRLTGDEVEYFNRKNRT